MNSMRNSDSTWFSSMKILIGLLLSANMLYFTLRYRELTNTVTVLQSKLAEQEKVRVIRTTEVKEKEPEKPVDDEPPLEYSQVLHSIIAIFEKLILSKCLGQTETLPLLVLGFIL